MPVRDMGLLQYIATLERQEQEYLKALEGVRNAMAHAKGVMGEHGTRANLSGLDEGDAPEEKAHGTDGPYAGIGLEEATYRYLVSVGRVQSTPQVRDGLVRGGLQSKAKNLHSTVFTSLRRLVDKDKVEKVGAGKWVAIGRTDQSLLGDIQ